MNRDVILERIRALQPISRVDLARVSGLQPSTVSSIVEQLLRERWIREGATIKTARGRPPTLLSLNDDLVILVADVRPGYATVALIDLKGRLLTRQIVPLGRSPELSVSLIAAAMQRIRANHKERTFEGIGLSLPGRVDPATNRLTWAPNLAWSHYDIAAELQTALGLEVQLENAANACLLSELWFSRGENLQNAVLVTISEGIGAAILVEGRLITGHRGLAGEFGHICVDPLGPLCGCGARGCWEVFASHRAALRYYKELQPNSEHRTIVELMALALDGDASAAAALERQALAIGQGLHLLNAVLSPDLILLVGDITQFTGKYRAIIDRECRVGLMAGEGPRLRSVDDGEFARLLGAAAVVLQRHSTYYRTSRKQTS